MTHVLLYRNLAFDGSAGFLTTERSEVVPFFRAVRGREREGCEATPPCGGEAPTKVAKRPFAGGGVPLRSWVFDD